MKNWIIITIILFLCKNENTLSDSIQILDKIVAIVNNTAILDSDIKNIINNIIYIDPNINSQLIKNKISYNNILNEEIIFQMILNFSKNNIITCNNSINENINIFLNNGNTELIKMLNNNFRKIYKCLDNNQFCLKRINREFLINDILNKEINSQIKILPEEINSLKKQFIVDYNNNIEIKLNHIFIPISEKCTIQKLKKVKLLANIIALKCKKKIDITKLIMKYSNRQKIKSEITHYKKLEELPSLFVKYLNNFQIKKNEVIGPIRSGIGLHILKIEDIKNHNPNLILKEVHISHIFMKPSILKSNKQIFSELNNVLVKIKNGVINFNNVAKLISEDYTSSNTGGDLGWISIEKLDKNIKKLILSLKKGEVSKPIYFNSGWHLFKLLDLRKKDYTDIMINSQINDLLFRRKFIEESSNWIKEKLASTYIKIIDNNYE